MGSLNVLLFHQIQEEPELRFSVSPRFFTACLDLVAEKGLVVTLPGKNVEDNASGNRGVILTFDDAWQSDLSEALPVLTRRGLNGVFFIPTGLLGTGGHMSWDGVGELADAGMEIGSHSHSHPYLTTLAPAQIREELSRSKRELEDRVGQGVSSLSIPHGDSNSAVRRLAREVGYIWLFESRPGLNRTPLAPGLPLRRNALTRGMTMEHLDRVIAPGLGGRLLQEGSYLGKQMGKTLLGAALWDRMKGGIRALGNG